MWFCLRVVNLFLGELKSGSSSVSTFVCTFEISCEFVSVLRLPELVCVLIRMLVHLLLYKYISVCSCVNGLGMCLCLQV